MSRRKKYIKGRVYIINDQLLVKHSKANRRIVAMNNNKNEMAVRRITSLYNDKGEQKKNVIPIEKYPDLPKYSGVENKTFRTTLRGKPILESRLKKTKTRLNKWDMIKIRKYRKPR